MFEKYLICLILKIKEKRGIKNAQFSYFLIWNDASMYEHFTNKIYFKCSLKKK